MPMRYPRHATQPVTVAVLRQYEVTGVTAGVTSSSRTSPPQCAQPAQDPAAEIQVRLPGRARSMLDQVRTGVKLISLSRMKR
jgi:hypothetical protein